MKSILIIILFTVSAIASAADYYISTSGNDSNSGLSSSTPWKTIAKVNSVFLSLKPGDRLLFNRGQTFYGTIFVKKSGIAGSPIVLGAYGSGENPIITGFTTITGWTNEGGGIYSKVIQAEAQTNMVTIDGIQYAMGRWPDKTYNIFESHISTSSITDNGLGDNIDWVGAEVVIRKNDWTLERCLITDHTGDKISYNPASTSIPYDKYGYFIQNDLRCVSSYGEWYHSIVNGKFYIYLGNVDPSTKTIKVATSNNIILNNTGSDYIIVENISFTGSICDAIDFSWNADWCILQKCEITFAGADGLRYSGSYGLIDNNSVSNCNRAGIGAFYSGTNNTITNNSATNIGIIPGQNKTIPGIWSPTCGIAVEYNDCLIQYNRIENIGYAGILLSPGANNAVVKNNFISSICLILDDGGGIYMNNSKATGRIIDGNIILYSIGNNDGTTNNLSLARGIYLDEEASSITVRNNTIAHCNHSGIILHRAYNNTIEFNTAFNNYSGIGFENWTASNTIYGNYIRGNILFAKTYGQFSLSFSSLANDISSFGTADYNYYARPVDDDDVFFTYNASTGTRNRTLADWQSLTKQDANSKKSPIAIINSNDILFEYNASKTNKVVTLTQPMIDVKGTKYVNSVTLLPYTSVVLMIDPNPAKPAVPIYIKSSVESITPSLLEMTFDINLAVIVPDPAAFSVQIKGVNRSVTSVAISGTKVKLTLSAPVEFGDIVTVSYTVPSVNKLQSLSGGATSAIINEPVTNNCPDPNKSNVAPTPVIKSAPSNYSGFIGEIDASGSFDLNNDVLAYEWISPNNVSLNSVSNSKINFLAPVVSTTQVYEFILKINDGISIITKSVPITIAPYKPELAAARISAISANSYQIPDFPNNVSDGILSTKWSATGDNQWLLLNLAEFFHISHLEIAFLPGQKYYSYFDIYASRDNLLWEPILTGASSCNFSGDRQIFDFPELKKKSEYLYVKLVGKGNSLNGLNSIGELKIYGKQSLNDGNSDTEGRKAIIYPNPARDFFNVTILEPTLVPERIRIIDLHGEVVHEEQVLYGNFKVMIPTELKSGLYILEFRSDVHTIETQKLIVNR